MRLTQYYWTFIKLFGKEVWRSGRTEVFSALGVSTIVFFISWLLQDATAFSSFKIAVIANACWLGLFALGHLIRTPWLILRDLATAASHHWAYGIVGTLAMGLMAAGILVTGLWLHSSAQLRPLPNHYGTPTDKDAEITQLKQKLDEIEHSQPQKGRVARLAPVVSQPPAPTDQQNGIQSQLEMLINANKNLPKGDRDRFADALFEFAEVLDQANTLWEKAITEGRQLGQASQSGSIAKEFEVHRNKLHEIESSAKDYEKAFSQDRQKWKYYGGQIEYIFGHNPDNNATIIRGAVLNYSTFLDGWVTIPNKQERPILNLLGYEQVQFDEALSRFIHWKQDCERRLEQMKSSIR